MKGLLKKVAPDRLSDNKDAQTATTTTKPHGKPSTSNEATSTTPGTAQPSKRDNEPVTTDKSDVQQGPSRMKDTAALKELARNATTTQKTRSEASRTNQLEVRKVDRSRETLGKTMESGDKALADAKEARKGKSQKTKSREAHRANRPKLSVEEKAARRKVIEENYTARAEAHDHHNKLRADELVDEIVGANGQFEQCTVTALPHWPPNVNDDQLRKLHEKAVAWSMSDGFVIVPAESYKRALVSHAPLSLFPTPFPRQLYRLAQTLQPILNSLYMRIAMDEEFLCKVFEGSVNHVDPWQNWLYYYYHQVKRWPNSKRALGIFRSDYLLHQTEPGKPLQIKQVEFNTIASSFGGLSEKAVNLHRHLGLATRGYWKSHPLLRDSANYAEPESASAIAASLADAHFQYCEEVGRKSPVILFVVQEGERNVFDQKTIEFILLHKYQIRVERRTFAQLGIKQKGLGVRRGQDLLYIKAPEHGEACDVEVAVVYFRAGYTPEEYGEEREEFRIRVLMEKSKAFVCPTFALQLAGAKKVQQVLTEPGVLEGFLLGSDRPDTGFGAGRGYLDENWCKLIRSTWVDMWPLDDSEMGQEGLALAMTEPERFVMKPQREGGGNNIYRTDIPPLLDQLSSQTLSNGRCPWERYVLMELIQPPQGLYNHLVKGGEDPRRVEVVSELGVYGTMLYGMPNKIRNKRAGILLRTKAKTSDEGGVAIGISSIDSPLLIDQDYVPPPPDSPKSIDDPQVCYHDDGFGFWADTDDEEAEASNSADAERSDEEWDMEYVEDISPVW